MGFAEGVTGGSGGRVVKVSNASDFKSHCESSEKVIIELTGKISDASATLASNKTILGLGATSEIINSTLTVKGDNIIIRNVSIHHQPKGADLITIYWNQIHDSFKAMLIGSSDSDLLDRKITFHHNHFYRLWERVPSFRGGTTHIFNNYFSEIEHSAIILRMGAKARIEGNVFEKVGSGQKDKNTLLEWGPIGAYYSKTKGDWDAKDNLFTACKGNQPTTSTTSFTPPYQYAKTLHPSSETKAMVAAWAGVGKYDDQSPINLRADFAGDADRGVAGTKAYNLSGQKVRVVGNPAKPNHGLMVVKDHRGTRVRLPALKK